MTKNPGITTEVCAKYGLEPKDITAATGYTRQNLESKAKRYPDVYELLVKGVAYDKLQNKVKEFCESVLQ